MPSPEYIRELEQYITDTPALLSLLYDIDLLPEQTYETRDYPRTLLIAEAWRNEFSTRSECK